MQTTTPTSHHSVFLQAGCPSWRPTNSVKALKAVPHNDLLNVPSVSVYNIIYSFNCRLTRYLTCPLSRQHPSTLTYRSCLQRWNSHHNLHQVNSYQVQPPSECFWMTPTTTCSVRHISYSCSDRYLIKSLRQSKNTQQCACLTMFSDKIWEACNNRVYTMMAEDADELWEHVVKGRCASAGEITFQQMTTACTSVSVSDLPSICCCTEQKLMLQQLSVNVMCVCLVKCGNVNACMHACVHACVRMWYKPFFTNSVISVVKRERLKNKQQHNT